MWSKGKAMLAAARKHNRVVQVGTQRRSTPHLIEARDRVVKAGKLGKIGMVEIYCYYHMRANTIRRTRSRPTTSTTRCWTGPAPRCALQSTTWRSTPHRRWWRAFMEYGNGIVGDMCIHMLDMVRWMCDLGWPRRVASDRRHSGAKGEQVEHLRHADRDVRLPASSRSSGTHRTYGAAADPEYPWGATIYGDKGTLKLSVYKYEFFPVGQAQAQAQRTSLFEYDKYPEDKTEKDLERHVASAIREHMRDFLKAREDETQAGRGHRAGAHLDRDLHPGQPLDETWPLADLGRGQASGRAR